MGKVVSLWFPGAGGAVFGGLGAEPPAAGGQWGSGGEALGSWGKAPRKFWAKLFEPPALENFAFFCKNNLILELIIKLFLQKNAKFLSYFNEK